MRLSHYTHGDKAIWLIVFFLSIISLPLIYSTTNTLALQEGLSVNSFLFKQALFIILGILIIYFSHKINYKLYYKIGVLLFYLSIPLLIYTFFFGIEINEASRWVSIPGTGLTIQTSEIAKVGLLLYICRYLSRAQDKIKQFKKGLVPILIPIGITAILMLPASLSAAVYIGTISLTLLFIGRAKISHLISVSFVAALPLLLLVGWVITAHQSDMDPDVLPHGRVNIWVNRIDQFLYSEVETEHYQVQQSKIAIAKGGWIGSGPGNSEQKNFLPSAFSDYIFSMLIEEYGTIGGIIIVLLYLLLTYRSVRIFKNCPYAFGGLLAIALSMNLLLSALLNISVNAHLLPVTGITLPFLSRGGTSFLIACFQVGIILSVSREVQKEQYKKNKLSREVHAKDA